MNEYVTGEESSLFMLSDGLKCSLGNTEFSDMGVEMSEVINFPFITNNLHCQNIHNPKALQDIIFRIACLNI